MTESLETIIIINKIFFALDKLLINVSLYFSLEKFLYHL